MQSSHVNFVQIAQHDKSQEWLYHLCSIQQPQFGLRKTPFNVEKKGEKRATATSMKGRYAIEVMCKYLKLDFMQQHVVRTYLFTSFIVRTYYTENIRAMETTQNSKK